MARQQFALVRRHPTRCYPVAAMVRQWQTLRLLERKACTVRELARDLHVSRLLIMRDLLVLERAGFPVYDYRDDDGHRRWSVLRRTPVGVELAGGVR